MFLMDFRLLNFPIQDAQPEYVGRHRFKRIQYYLERWGVRKARKALQSLQADLQRRQRRELYV